MGDYSLLIIKPEILSTKKEVIASLARRGYSVLFEQEFDNWREFAHDYLPKNKPTKYTKDEIDVFLEEYIKNQWGNKYAALIVQHKDGNTLNRLREEKGHFGNYQTKKEDTLRGEFGLGPETNVNFKNAHCVYNGIHTVDDEQALKEHLAFLNIALSYFMPANK